MKYLVFLLLNFFSLVNIIKSHDIIVKIKGSGQQNLINKNAKANCPDETKYINGTKIGNNICSSKLDKEENTIILTWYNAFTGYELFKDMKNITEIYFFNCTIITSMHRIFYNCINLKYINFTGLYINSKKSPVDTNYGAFKNCKSLYSLDLSPLILPELDFRFIFDNCINLEYINTSL